MSRLDDVERGWKGCTLVNPLCPDDLCDLPKSHEGNQPRWAQKHRLSTYSEPGTVSKLMFMAPKGTSRETLIQMGREKAKELFPDEQA